MTHPVEGSTSGGWCRCGACGRNWGTPRENSDKWGGRSTWAFPKVLSSGRWQGGRQKSWVLAPAPGSPSCRQLGIFFWMLEMMVSSHHLHTPVVRTTKKKSVPAVHCADTWKARRHMEWAHRQGHWAEAILRKILTRFSTFKCHLKVRVTRFCTVKGLRAKKTIISLKIYFT